MLFQNPHVGTRAPSTALQFVGADAPAAVMKYLAQCSIHKPTPLHCLAGLAAKIGVGDIYYKDEAQRLSLQSFKALGGVYAIMEVLRRRAAATLRRDIAPANLFDDDVRALARRMTFICASDGNHGRSVAAGAKLVGSRCIVLVHEGVSETRARWIRDLGADVQRVPGTYDQSVELARETAARNGWFLISDTSLDDDDEIPGIIMRGYTVIADEMLTQLKHAGKAPTHIFVQAGVGGLAAAMSGHLAARLGTRRPRFIVVEPEHARCLFESARVGHAVEFKYEQPTIFAMLECNRPSSSAWKILSQYGDFFMTIPDEMAAVAMRALAFPTAADVSLIVGESGSAGLAGLLAVSASPEDREAIGLSPASVVLIIGTEGATDAGAYERLVGVSPQAVGQR